MFAFWVIVGTLAIVFSVEITARWWRNSAWKRLQRYDSDKSGNRP